MLLQSNYFLLLLYLKWLQKVTYYGNFV